MEDKEERRKLLNLVRDLLPFVRNFSVEKFADRSLIFELHEVYSDKHHLPASLISDGTINVLALVIALYFEGKSLAIIEEPERNMHPHLVSKIVEMMKDAAQKNKLLLPRTTLRWLNMPVWKIFCSFRGTKTVFLPFADRARKRKYKRF